MHLKLRRESASGAIWWTINDDVISTPVVAMEKIHSEAEGVDNNEETFAVNSVLLLPRVPAGILFEERRLLGMGTILNC